MAVFDSFFLHIFYYKSDKTDKTIIISFLERGLTVAGQIPIIISNEHVIYEHETTLFYMINYHTQYCTYKFTKTKNSVPHFFLIKMLTNYLFNLILPER